MRHDVYTPPNISEADRGEYVLCETDMLQLRLPAVVRRFGGAPLALYSAFLCAARHIRHRPFQLE